MSADHITQDAALPEVITVDFQPYGLVKLHQLSLGSYNGFPLIQGTVLEGTTTSRLFGCSSTKSCKGDRRTVYGVRKSELESGHFIRVAM